MPHQMPINFTNRVAIVTGAGGGLGRQHALALAARGAKVVVNDFGQKNTKSDELTAAEMVAKEIVDAGGIAIANNSSVTDEVAINEMAKQALDQWGRIDILINNAGILRDKSFSKISLEDFRLVFDVHVMGAVICTKAVWDIMREQKYGRILMTTSSSGMYGNFGQSNYGAAKMALVGLMQTLSLEGMKFDIRVNCLAPTAATQMTEGLWSEEILQAFRPEYVTPAALVLVSEDAPNRKIICGGAGTFSSANITLTGGEFIGRGYDATELLRENFSQVCNRSEESVPKSAEAQGINEATKAAKSLSVGVI